MDAIELQNRLKNVTHLMVNLCESVPLTARCRVFEHQLLSFAYALDAPAHSFRQNTKPLEVSLNIACDETRHALTLLNLVADQKFISVQRSAELATKGEVIAAMFTMPVMKNQLSNRNN